MDLGGSWRAVEADEARRRSFPDPDLDDSGWEAVEVPGHWRCAPTFAASDGPLLYRRRFEAEPVAEGRRRWLRLDGIFYQGDVWLDGAYLGDTEGYFFPHTFEITQPAAERSEHLLAIEVACHRPRDRRAKRNLTGIFQHWDCIESSWNPGGIWAPVALHDTGAVQIAWMRVACPDATAERATLDIEVVLDAASGTPVLLSTEAARDGQAVTFTESEHTLAAGANRVRWRLDIERPELWWPHSLGAQPLYDLTVRVRTAGRGGEPGAVSDERRVRTGLRQIRMRNFITTVNGERLFLKGTNCGPTRRALAEATPEELAGDVTAARRAGLDLIRVHAHITRRELYEAADEQGMLIWQDLPLQWGYSGVRHQAVRQARQAVAMLGHHPSVAIWCGHNEPLALDLDPSGKATPATIARFGAGQMLPTWNKTVLDRSIKRSLDKADGSRPVVAHSGVLPHPAGGTDSHLYFGWYHGDERDLPAALARLPVLARFLSEFGAQAVPTQADFLQPDRWPNLEWERLQREFLIQPAIFEARVPPAGHASFESWRDATQRYQAEVIRFHIETLRRLKYRPTGGFCQFLLADAQPAVSWSVLDHRREPKEGYQALREACLPVIAVADRPAESYRPGDRLSLDLHVVSDRRSPISGELSATLAWPGGQRVWRFTGEVPADSCVMVGSIHATFPSGLTAGGAVELRLRFGWQEPDGAHEVTNRYSSSLLAGS
ncbi:MAG: glycoside hydrolase family 2 protein [Acidimicrobiales bacterium]